MFACAVLWVLLLLGPATCSNISSVTMLSPHQMLVITAGLGQFTKTTDLLLKVGKSVLVPTRAVYQGDQARIYMILPSKIGDIETLSVTNLKSGVSANTPWLHIKQKPSIVDVSSLSGPITGHSLVTLELKSWPIVTDVSSCSVAFGEIPGRVTEIQQSDLYLTRLVIEAPTRRRAGPVDVELSYTFSWMMNAEIFTHQVSASFTYLYTNPDIQLVMPSANPSTSTVGVIPFTFAVMNLVTRLGPTKVAIQFGNITEQSIMANTVASRNRSYTTITWITVTPPSLPVSEQARAENGKVMLAMTVVPSDDTALGKEIALYFTYHIPLTIERVAFDGGRYRHLIATFSMDVEESNPGETFECNRVVSADTIKELGGQSAECTWSSLRTFSIHIPEIATVTVGTKLHLVGGVIRPMRSALSDMPMLGMVEMDVVVEDDPDFYLPIAEINGPTRIAAAQDSVKFSARSSFGRHLTFHWECKNVNDSQVVLQTVNQSQPDLTFPATRLLPGGTFSVTLVVTDFRGRSSLPTRVRLQRSKVATIPVLHIAGPAEIWTDVTKGLILQVHDVAEVPKMQPMDLVWEETSGSELHRLGSGPILHVPENTLAPNRQLTVRVKGSMAGEADIGSANVVVHTVLPQSRMCIAGGMKRTLAIDDALQLSALVSRGSGDVHNRQYRWSCLLPDGTACTTAAGSPLNISSVQELSFEAFTFPEGYFSFSVVAMGSKYGEVLHANHTVHFRPVNAHRADIEWIQPLESLNCGRINIGDKLMLQSSEEKGKHAWSVTKEDGSAISIPARATLGLTDRALVLFTQSVPSFMRGGVYLIHANSATARLTFNQPPTGGICSLSPKSGVSMKTRFTITCSGWHDPDHDMLSYQLLRYTFRYRSISGTTATEWTSLQVAGHQSSIDNFLLPSRSPRMQVQAVILDDEDGKSVWMNIAKIQEFQSFNQESINSTDAELDPLQVTLRRGLVGQALSMISHSAEQIRRSRQTSRRLLAESTATKLLNYVVSVRTALAASLSVSAGTVGQLLTTLSVVARLSSQLTVTPYNSSDIVRALGVLYDCADVYNTEMTEMTDKIAQDMWTSLAWLMTDDVLDRVYATDLTPAKSEMQWVQNKIGTTATSVKNVIRRWKLVNKFPDEPAFVVDAESMEKGSARISVRKMQKALLTGCVTTVQGTSCDGVNAYPLRIKFPTEVSALVTPTVDTALWTLPRPYSQSGKVFFGHMFGAAVADPNSTIPFSLTGLSKKIALTITVPEFLNQSSLPSGYAECVYWKYSTSYWDLEGVTNKPWEYGGSNDGYPDHGPNVTCFTTHLDEFALENINAALRPTPAPPTHAPTPAPTAAPTLQVTNTPPYWTMSLDSNEHRLGITSVRSPYSQRRVTLFDETDPALPLDRELRILLDGFTPFSTTYVGASLVRDGGPTDPDLVSVEYKAVITGAGGNATNLGLNITYEIVLAHAGVKFKDTDAFDLEDPGFPCFTRRLLIKPSAPGHYLRPGKTLLVSLPNIEIQILVEAYINTTNPDPTAILYRNEGMFADFVNPWSQSGGNEIQAWCEVNKPTDDLLAVCHINPNARYGCPFRHPSATPRAYTASHPQPTASERCRYASPLHKDKLCSYGYSGIEKFTVYNSEATGGTLTFTDGVLEPSLD